MLLFGLIGGPVAMGLICFLPFSGYWRWIAIGMIFVVGTGLAVSGWSLMRVEGDVFLILDGPQRRIHFVSPSVAHYGENFTLEFSEASLIEYLHMNTTNGTDSWELFIIAGAIHYQVGMNTDWDLWTVAKEISMATGAPAMDVEDTRGKKTIRRTFDGRTKAAQ